MINDIKNFKFCVVCTQAMMINCLRLFAIAFGLTLALPSTAQHPENLALGGGHTCVITSSNAVRCWGSNGDGELGDGTTLRRTSPVAVINLPTTVAALTSGGNTTCLRTTDGSMRCWGGNRDGLIGDGTNTNRPSPTIVSGLATGVVAMSGGGNSMCAVLNTGAVRCWGLNTYGELGDGSKINRNAPVSVAGLTNATAVAVGSFHACAIVSGGRVKCWGRNNSGQLGNGTTTDSVTPVDVTGLSGVTQLIAGSSHNCARLNTSALRCWGMNNQFQVGSVLGTDQLTPVPAPISSSNNSEAMLSAVSAGDQHSCAITSPETQPADLANTIYCWGNNASRQLGDNVQTSAQVGAGFIRSGYATIASKGSHNCAISLTGELHCWGNNNNGQLGQGTTTRLGVPTAVPGITMTVPTATTGPMNYTDMWWAGQIENGWGMSIQQHSSGVQFNALYIYDAQGQPRWYVMPGGTWSNNFTTYTGSIYQPTGAPLNNYNSAQLVVGNVLGTVTLNFTGPSAVTLSYTINGVSGTKTMSRQSFAGGTAPFNVADMWWGGSAENGWGVSIAQQQGALFSVWYTYGLDNKALWFVMPGGTWTGNTYSGPFYATTGSPWLSATYNAAALAVQNVGSMTLSFTSATAATMSYSFTAGAFAGTTRSRAIERQSY